MKSFSETTMTTAIPTTGSLRAKPDGRVIGKPYFNCSPDIFAKCQQGKKKGERWSKFMGEGEFTDKIREFSKTKEGKQFMLKKEGSHEYIFIRKFM